MRNINDEGATIFDGALYYIGCLLGVLLPVVAISVVLLILVGITKWLFGL